MAIVAARGAIAVTINERAANFIIIINIYE